MNKPRVVASAVLLCCLVLASVALAQSSSAGQVSWHVLAGGGGRQQSARYSMSGTLGQPVANGPSASSSYELGAGYWHGVAVARPTATPQATIYLPLAVRQAAAE